jgi:hypothetical protein
MTTVRNHWWLLERPNLPLRVAERMWCIHTPRRLREGDAVTTRQRSNGSKYERVAREYVMERNFTWRQSSLRMLQIHLAGLGVGSATATFLHSLAGIALMFTASSLSLVHEYVKTVDRRRHATALQEDAIRLGVLAEGGFGRLPASSAGRLSGDMDTPGMRELAARWHASHVLTPEEREIFDALSGEFYDTLDALYATSVGLAEARRNAEKPA